jgi:hypothetical protein
MTDALLLLIIVVGVVALALVVDVGALITWLRRSLTHRRFGHAA